MASLCFSTPPTLLALPKQSNYSINSTYFNQISFRNSVSPPLAFNPLRCSVNSTRRFSTVVSMASSGDKTNDLWNSLGKSIENFGKKPSVEDLLRQQIEKQEYYDEGGGGGNRLGGGGGGGGGAGGSDGLGGSEEEGFSGILDETIQVILATLGFIFMYVYIINGAEMTRLAKDYISYLFGGRKSIRLTRAMYQWERFCKKLTEKEEVDKFWLEKAILTTPTWWDSPEKYKLLLRALVQQHKSDADEEIKDEYGSQAGGEMSDEYY
ncbi:hypothetical protein RND81_10G114200 [Saponaria officinalis]|uniref:Uncharacterized protein n=1 Tax=Saponaria officinalis TaxID=3572 RepID=A0AAW1I3K7_SAPOF